MAQFYTIFLFFFIYSVIGWMVETTYCRILDGKWTNRGFMFGPYCPIYGFGSLLVIYFLDYFKESPIKVFFLGMIFTSLLEYISSFLLEKMFNAKWWDYSDRKFNINGRICLLNSLEFAILGLLLTYIVHPFVSALVYKIPYDIIQFISVMIFTFLIIDCCSTVFSLLNLKEKLAFLEDITEKFKENELKSHKHITDFAIYNEFKEFRTNLISRRNILIERFLDAFPKFEFRKFRKQLDEFRLDLHLFKEELRKNREEDKIKKKEIKRLKEKS